MLRDSEFSQVSANTISNGIARGGRDPLVVTESGLFGLIMTSRKPEAEKFRYWVRSAMRGEDKGPDTQL